MFTNGLDEGWAEAETEPARIEWGVRQEAAAIPFEVVGGRPVNPRERTGIAHGRNQMGYWGETLMADALVTTVHEGMRWMLLVERGDGYGWAVPGGHTEEGESGLAAAERELAEETGLAVGLGVVTVMEPRYVPDPRASDEAWAVTVPVAVALGVRDTLPEVTGGGGARRARWIPARSYGELESALAAHYGGRVFAAHQEMLREFLRGA